LMLVCLIVGALALDPRELEQGLKSAEGQVKLFSSWMKQEHNHYSSSQEKSFRFRVFRGHLKEIVATNSAQGMYTLDVNFMAGLTKEEQQQYYGINASLPSSYESDYDGRIMSGGLSEASAIDWRAKGKVGPVKNQGGCGSCWTFGGTAAFEGHYAIQTGSLQRFAEQELLDCTYEKLHMYGAHDGCNGGWYWHGFDMIKMTQHFSLEKDYPYKAKDNKCDLSNKKNGMVGVESWGKIRPRRSKNDGSLVTALNMGPVSMAFEVKGGMQYYQEGILSIENCGANPHHAMAVTGYTADYFQIKNSWGASWGDHGYVKFDRKIENMCGISNWLSYPILQKSDDKPDPTDAPTVAPTDKPTDGPTHAPTIDPYPDCQDETTRCAGKVGDCTNIHYQWMAQYCKKTCGLCGCNDSKWFTKCAEWKEQGYCEKGYHSFMNTAFMKIICPATCGHCQADKKCPDGLTFCGGKCQHEHFCH